MRRFLFFIAFLLSFQHVFAVSEYAEPSLYIQIVAVWVVVISIVIFSAKSFVEKHKKLFFNLIVIPVVISSLYLAGFTVYENIISETGGPIHWHADYQVVLCGERLDLVDPNFPSNKIGSPLFHEHNDDRIHVEGTVLELDDIQVGDYFEVIGGKLSNGHLIFPTEDRGVIDVRDGDSCNGVASTLKVFLNGERLDDYENYLYYPDAYVPPGDCLIIEFSPGDAQTTDRICESWSAQGFDYTNYKRPAEQWGDYSWPSR